MRFSISRQLRVYHSDMDVLFSYFFDGVCNRHVFPSIYMLNDPRYTVADPRYTSSVLHILPSHTLEYRASEHWKNKNAGNVAKKRMHVRIWNIAKEYMYTSKYTFYD